jgi:hypothetical protein
LEDEGLAADAALEIDEPAAEPAAETAELAALTCDESEALKEDTEADAADLDDDRAAVSVLRIMNEALNSPGGGQDDLRGSGGSRLADAHECGYLS